MSDYANARFKSKLCTNYQPPKGAREYTAPSDPYMECGSANLVSQRSTGIKKLRDRSRLVAECTHRPQIYHKVANTVRFDSFKRRTFVNDSVVAQSLHRAVVQPNLFAPGTVQVSSKPKAIIERAGQMYQHPSTSYDEQLLRQKALRSSASLPSMLQELLRRLEGNTPGNTPGNNPPTPASKSQPLHPPVSKTDAKPSKPVTRRSVKVPVDNIAVDATFTASPLTESSERSESSSASKKRDKAILLVEYLQEIQGALNETNSSNEVDPLLTDDMKLKGFDIPNTRTNKTEMGLYRYIDEQIIKLNRVVNK